MINITGTPPSAPEKQPSFSFTDAEIQKVKKKLAHMFANSAGFENPAGLNQFLGQTETAQATEDLSKTDILVDEMINQMDYTDIEKILLSESEKGQIQAGGEESCIHDLHTGLSLDEIEENTDVLSAVDAYRKIFSAISQTISADNKPLNKNELKKVRKNIIDLIRFEYSHFNSRDLERHLVKLKFGKERKILHKEVRKLALAREVANYIISIKTPRQLRIFLKQPNIYKFWFITHVGHSFREDCHRAVNKICLQDDTPVNLSYYLEDGWGHSDDDDDMDDIFVL